MADAKIVTIEDALKLAIEALNEQAEEKYEGDEQLEPEAAEYIDKRFAAASLLRRQLKKVSEQ
jgi:20S proteasome alpha/beta subunit